MAASWITVVVMTGLWGIIGCIVPWFVPKGPNKGIIQTMLVMTAVCCFMLWLCTFLMQLNPLIGPELETYVIKAIKWEWEGHE